ncbi:MAG: BON domain-containing protein [Acidobacteriaceae bacterium]|nr:BON domain-containing protein [Acidobacteriaceae bacterium]
MKTSLGSMLSGALLASSLILGSGTPLLANTGFYQAPDNTAANKTDRSPNVPTADNAKNDQSDLALEKHIRRDLVKDKSLSTYGHNVKIVASGGKVTLRGPVRSEEEKKAIEEHATKYAGAGNVINDLSVKGS